MRSNCPNINHRRASAQITVRCCSICGEVVNENVRSARCSEATHAKRRKQRDLYCIDCGEGLRQGR